MLSAGGLALSSLEGVTKISQKVIVAAKEKYLQKMATSIDKNGPIKGNDYLLNKRLLKQKLTNL